MISRLLLPAVLSSACSLDGLADGSDTGGAGASTSTSTSTSTSATGGAGGSGVGGEAGSGGAGGAPNPFQWMVSFGNDSIQGTSPYSTDTRFGSSLRMSEPGLSGDVWIAATTMGSIDFDGSGPEPAIGNPSSSNVFLLHLDAGGAMLAFRAFPGDLADLAISVSGLTRLSDGTLALVGTFKGGGIDFSPAGTVTQIPSHADDGFVLRVDEDGEPLALRQLGDVSSQVVSGLASYGQEIFVAGKLRSPLSVINPADGNTDDACEFLGPDDLDRALVAVFDATTLTCERIVKFGANLAGARQQAYAISVDATGMYLAGIFTGAFLAPPHPSMSSTSDEDGFVLAVEPTAPFATRWIARATSGRASAKDGLLAVLSDGGQVWVGGYLEHGTSGNGLPTLGTVPTSPTACALLTLPNNRDGLIGAFNPATGACLGATTMGLVGQDEVHALAPRSGGVLASGLTSAGLLGVDESLGKGSRDGFVVRFIAPAVFDGGFVIGGGSWDYADGAIELGDTVVVAGSFNEPFGDLAGSANFFAAALLPPQ